MKPSEKKMECESFPDAEKQGGYFIKPKDKYTWRRCQIYCQTNGIQNIMKKRLSFQSQLFEPGQGIQPLL